MENIKKETKERKQKQIQKNKGHTKRPRAKIQRKTRRKIKPNQTKPKRNKTKKARRNTNAHKYVYTAYVMLLLSEPSQSAKKTKYQRQKTNKTTKNTKKKTRENETKGDKYVSHPGGYTIDYLITYRILYCCTWSNITPGDNINTPPLDGFPCWLPLD